MDIPGAVIYSIRIIFPIFLPARHGGSYRRVLKMCDMVVIETSLLFTTCSLLFCLSLQKFFLLVQVGFYFTPITVKYHTSLCKSASAHFKVLFKYF